METTQASGGQLQVQLREVMFAEALVLVVDDSTESALVRASATSSALKPSLSWLAYHDRSHDDPADWWSADLRVFVVHSSVGTLGAPMVLSTGHLTDADLDVFAGQITAEIMRPMPNAEAPPPLLELAVNAGELLSKTASLTVGVTIVSARDDQSPAAPNSYRRISTAVYGIFHDCAPLGPRLAQWRGDFGPTDYGCPTQSDPRLVERWSVDYAYFDWSHVGDTCQLTFSSPGLGECDSRHGWNDPKVHGQRTPTWTALFGGKDRVCEIAPLEGAARQACATTIDDRDETPGFCLSHAFPGSLWPLRFVAGARPQLSSPAVITVICNLKE